MHESTDTIVIKAKDDNNPLASVDKKTPGKQVIKSAITGKVLKVVTVCGKTLTEQSHKRDTDMNFILQEYQKTGMIRHAKQYEGKYDDVTMQDFQDAMFLVTRAQNMFNDLPSSLRERFENDPAQFIQFTNNPDNTGEMIKLGIIKGVDGFDAEGNVIPPPVVEPQPVVIVEPEPT